MLEIVMGSVMISPEGARSEEIEENVLELQLLKASVVGFPKSLAFCKE